MKMIPLRNCIILGSLAINVIAQAGPLDNATQFQAPGLKPILDWREKAPEIVKPIAPIEIEPFRPVRPIRPRPTEILSGKGATSCIDLPSQDRLAFNGNDDGCIKKPTKPIRPVPTRSEQIA